jgi:hypothetical protein
VNGACFEFEPDGIEGTNFDFMIPLNTGSRIYFEVKYTETGFGSADADEEHLRKFEDLYYPATDGRFEPEFCTAAGFLQHYQIVRNLWHLDLVSGDTAVFLLPLANRALARSEGIIRSCLLEAHRARVIVVYMEDFVSALVADLDVRCEAQRNALSEFRLKYFPARENQGVKEE